MGQRVPVRTRLIERLSLIAGADSLLALLALDPEGWTPPEELDILSAMASLRLGTVDNRLSSLIDGDGGSVLKNEEGLLT